MTTEQKTEEQKPEAGQKPAAQEVKIEDSPEFKAAVRKATSQYQSDGSKSRKELRASQAENERLRRENLAAQQEAEVARLAGDDEDEARRVRARLALNANLDEREKKLTEQEVEAAELRRQYAIATLAERHGIPVEELETKETLEEMEAFAEKSADARKIEALEKEIAELKDGDPPAEKGPGFDVGSGQVKSPSVDWVKLAQSDPKEFDRRLAEVTREASRRSRR